MATADKKRRNVLAIIEMFANLGLPVCDDEVAITAKRDEQRSARNRELNSTKGTVAARAQKWFDNVNALLNRRDELLAIVYSEFASLADAVLCANIDRGETKLGPDTEIALRDIAMSWCRARPDLANRWLQEYLEQRGLHEGQNVDKPMLVRNFRAQVRAGHVQLSWGFPAERCEEVKIVRVPDPMTADATESTVYQGKETVFVDKNVSPKGHYIYRAYSVFEGRRSLTSCAAHTKRQHTSSNKAAWLCVAALVLAAGGAFAYDHFFGSEGEEKPARAWMSEVLGHREVPELPDEDTPEVPGDAEDGGQPASDGETPDTTAPADDPETTQDPDLAAPPFEAAMISPPSVAFAGQSFRMEIECGRSVRAALLEPQLEGLRVKRFDLETDIPTVVFQVDELPEGAVEGTVRWSFRLADEFGRPSTLVQGECSVW